MPMAVAFMVAFTYTFYQAMELMLVEMVAYILASFLTESIATFFQLIYSVAFWRCSNRLRCKDIVYISCQRT